MTQENAPKIPPRDPLKHRLELIGWVIFVFSALCFIVASIGDPWAMAGSVLFLLACIVFLVPYLRRDP